MMQGQRNVKRTWGQSFCKTALKEGDCEDDRWSEEAKDCVVPLELVSVTFPYGAVNT